MEYYFKLQYKILTRKMENVGFSPFRGILTAIIGFYGISYYLSSRLDFFEYFYVFISLILVSKIGNNKRNDFLKSIFSKKSFFKLRLIENLILVFPFILFLIYKKFFLFSILLIIASIILSRIVYNNINFIIPTPFNKIPFEFPIGFRKTFYMFPIAYFLTYQAIIVNNLNFGIFSMLLVGIVVLTYYSVLETKYYVWSFNLNSKNFIANKIKIGLLLFSSLALPIIISLIYYFPNELKLIILFIFLIYVYIITIILAKYSIFPNKMGFSQSIIIGISVIFPPILLAIIPYFYIHSIKQLKFLLDNDNN